MPIYEYQCAECGEKYTILCKLEQRRKTCKCAMCGGPCDLRVSSPAFKINGYAPGRDIKRKNAAAKRG